MPLLIEDDLFTFPLQIMWVLKGNTLSTARNGLIPGRNLNRDAKHDDKAIELVLVVTHLKHLSNFVLMKRVVVLYLTSELTTPLVREITEIKIYFRFSSQLPRSRWCSNFKTENKKVRLCFDNAPLSTVVSVAVGNFYASSEEIF